MNRKPDGELRRGWTTGACATAATKAAVLRLVTGTFPEMVTITLPRGETPAFALAETHSGADWAEVGIVKDAGDDPDVTHGALIRARVCPGVPGSGVIFHAGDGVGMVTRPGLPVPVGDPAINPVPRQMMTDAIDAVAAKAGIAPDFEITISVPGGADLAAKTWNPRLGILGGISILGTTGIVRPFSCAAWIASIHRGIDVARAEGLTHVAGCTGATSERVVQDLYGIPAFGMLDMGDFVGGMIKYLARNPVPRLTIGGGFGKITKLAQGAMDLHSGRSQVDFEALATLARETGAGPVAEIRAANTAMEALALCPALALPVAKKALDVAAPRLPETKIDIVIISRDGTIMGRAGD